MTFVISIFQLHCKSEQKKTKKKTSETKLNGTCENLVVFSLIYKLQHYLIDF